jgi:hypothetical protein
MDIPIKISATMDAKNNPFESRVARLPKLTRDTHNFPLGEFITLKNKQGRATGLPVEPAYSADTAADPLAIYVTSAVFKGLATRKAVSSTSCDVELVDGLTLGCDPELIILDRLTGNAVSAQTFFGLTKWKQVGYDGILLEFRPSPSPYESVVVDNIGNLLNVARQQYLNNCQMFPQVMMAGISSYIGPAAVARNLQQNTPMLLPNTTLTTGFHLHYGLPKEILGWHKKFVAEQMVKALDYYVGIPSIIPEGYNDSYRRTVQGVEYGKPGMFRLDHRTLEYRTPGGALMKHPVLAQGLLALGAVVMEDIVSRGKEITSGFTQLKEFSTDADIRCLYPNIPPVMEIFRSICSPTTDVAKSHLQTIRADVSNMVGYARRAVSINNFFDNIETEFSIDVEENWRYHNNGKRQSG